MMLGIRVAKLITFLAIVSAVSCAPWREPSDELVSRHHDELQRETRVLVELQGLRVGFHHGGTPREPRPAPNAVEVFNSCESLSIRSGQTTLLSEDGPVVTIPTAIISQLISSDDGSIQYRLSREDPSTTVKIGPLEKRKLSRLLEEGRDWKCPPAWQEDQVRSVVIVWGGIENAGTWRRFRDELSKSYFSDALAAKHAVVAIDGDRVRVIAGRTAPEAARRNLASVDVPTWKAPTTRGVGVVGDALFFARGHDIKIALARSLDESVLTRISKTGLEGVSRISYIWIGDEPPTPDAASAIAKAASSTGGCFYLSAGHSVRAGASSQPRQK